jgi:Na+/melibiose symporter-like transporter
VFFAFVTLSAKLGAAAPLIVLYPILAAAGFKTTGPSSPHANNLLAALFVLVPMLCNVGGLLLMRRFPLDRGQHAALQEQLFVDAPAQAE